MMTNEHPDQPDLPEEATPVSPTEADRRKAMERMLGLLAAAPAAALLFDPRRAEAFGDGSFE